MRGATAQSLEAGQAMPVPPRRLARLHRSCAQARRGKRSGAVTQFARAFRLGTMSATKNRAAFFHAVTNDMGAAVRASRRDPLDRAFETIERVGNPVQDHLKRLVIVVSAGFASCHYYLTVRFVDIAEINPESRRRFPSEHPPVGAYAFPSPCPVWNRSQPRLHRT